MRNRSFNRKSIIFFLQAKSELLDRLKPDFVKPNVIKRDKLSFQFCAKDEKPPKALENYLPILIHACPDDFSTVTYFDVSIAFVNLPFVRLAKIGIFFFYLFIQTLNTKEVGRLVIYAPIINSTMNLVTNINMGHGVAVIGRKQTAGIGRHNNQVNSMHDMS